jgi:RNA polymerase sigma factor (sigma-70 family)
MMTTDKGYAAKMNDAELVAASLAGGREAFRQIVERHQTLVCSLAYCATGSLTQSEDLAQETFLVAWRQLAELREPSKLRPWLCGIARFVIGKELRQQAREPVHAAETLEMVNELAGPEPLPSESVISKEEEAILWHCVARIPESYREPLVLFYREHQSIERVAEALELSEDAVKQRLARGRRLLQAQALAYVEGALQRTNPGHAFTAGVLAALPISANSAKALTVGAAVKSSSTIKTVASLGALGAILLYWSLLGFLAFVGGCAGYWMSQASARSSRQCENVLRFWRTLAWGFAVSFIIRQFLLRSPTFHSHSAWFIWKLCQDLFYVVIVAALAIWLRRWWREFSLQNTDTQEHSRQLNRRFILWLSLGMIGPACCFVPIPGAMLWHAFGPATVQHLSDAEVQSIINERKVAYFNVITDENGTKTLQVNVRSKTPGSKLWAGTQPAWWNFWRGDAMPEWWIAIIAWTGWRPVEMSAVADEPTIKLLNENGIHIGAGRVTHPSRDTWPFSSLWPFFIAPMGVVLILSQFGRGKRTKASPKISETLDEENKHGDVLLALRADPSARIAFCTAFAITFLLAFSANAFTATKALTAMGLYVVLFLGSVKGAFFGLLAGVGVVCLRTRRKNSKS